MIIHVNSKHRCVLCSTGTVHQAAAADLITHAGVNAEEKYRSDNVYNSNGYSTVKCIFM